MKVSSDKLAACGVGDFGTVNEAAPVIDKIKLDEILDDIKKLKATVRKQNKRIQKLEKQLGEVAGDDVEEEEE